MLVGLWEDLKFIGLSHSFVPVIMGKAQPSTLAPADPCKQHDRKDADDDDGQRRD